MAPTAEVLQEPAKMEVGEDESIAALPKYDTPPPLDLTAPRQAIGRGTRIPEKPHITILDATVNSQFGKFGSPKKDLYEKESAQDVCPRVFKGPSCEYSGIETNCNKTEKTCRELGQKADWVIPNTKLPFPFDAEAFGRHVYIPELVDNDGTVKLPERDGMPDAILEDGSMMEFKTASPNVVSGQRAIKPWDVIGSGIDPDYQYYVKGRFGIKGDFIPEQAEQVTQTGQQALGELIEQLPEEYKESLLNSRIDSFQQEFTHGSPELDADAAKLDAMFGEGSSGPTMPNEGVLFFDDKGMNPSSDPVCKTCNGTGMIRRSIRHDVDCVEEWDDDCPDCCSEELPIDKIMPGRFTIPKGLEPGSYTCQLNDKLEMVNVMPFLPNEEALLPEPKVGLEDREVLSSESWLGLITPTESIAYDNHTALVMQSNPLHAAHLIRLKGFKSKYLQAIITTPEMAEEHIRVAIVRGEDPGGWDNSDHRRITQAQGLIARGFEVKAKAEARQRHRLYVQQTRNAWKQAVEYRKSALEILDTDVANKKETFQLARDMSFNEYMARFEPSD